MSLLPMGAPFAGRFSPELLVAEGEHGRVYRAMDARSGRQVALKVLASNPPAWLTERHLLEAALLQRVTHPALARYVAHGEGWLATAWIEGEDLRETLRRRGSLDAHDACLVAARVADAVAAVHDAGAAHRDVKPANVRLAGGAPEGATLLDLGVARPLDRPARDPSGALIGTPRYMSPEQARGLTVGPATDVWSIGASLVEMLTGAPPFDGDTLGELLASIVLAPAPPVDRPGVSPALRALVAALLEKDPHARPGPREVAERCRAIARG